MNLRNRIADLEALVLPESDEQRELRDYIADTDRMIHLMLTAPDTSARDACNDYERAIAQGASPEEIERRCRVADERICELLARGEDAPEPVYPPKCG